MVILSEDSEIAYCLFEKFDIGNDTYYRIRKIYTINKEFLNPDFERQVKIMEKTEEMKDF